MNNSHPGPCCLLCFVQGQSNIRDELSEAIVLSDVMALVGEWIPFGANQIVALNERLGYSRSHAVVVCSIAHTRTPLT